MRHSTSSADSPECLLWCRECSQRLHEIEPRLSETDCADLAGSLWQLDSYRRVAPREAAEKFLAENLEMLVAVLSS